MDKNPEGESGKTPKKNGDGGELGESNSNSSQKSAKPARLNAGTHSKYGTVGKSVSNDALLPASSSQLDVNVRSVTEQIQHATLVGNSQGATLDEVTPAEREEQNRANDRMDVSPTGGGVNSDSSSWIDGENVMANGNTETEDINSFAVETFNGERIRADHFDCVSWANLEAQEDVVKWILEASVHFPRLEGMLMFDKSYCKKDEWRNPYDG